MFDAQGPERDMFTRKGAWLLIKRAMDVSVAFAAGALLSPFLGAIAIASIATQGRPILFRQTRPGLRGEPFTILKFRTMRAPRKDEVWYLTDRERLTPLGRFLRATSLDELPELWNVLKGEMSLVGPRPLLMEYLEHYSTEERRRHDMRPGITGWAAVNGRHVLKFRDRLKLDVWYVAHWSLWLDLKILAMTLVQVLQRSDVKETQDPRGLGFPLPTAAAPRDAAGELRTDLEPMSESAPRARLPRGASPAEDVRRIHS
jgi:sugar transferase EpsL